MGFSLKLVGPVLSGMALMGAWGSGLFFFRFWKKTRDHFFFWFGAAFWIFALERALLAFMEGPRLEVYAFVYLIRLAAFLMLLIAILDKNRSERKVNS